MNSQKGMATLLIITMLLMVSLLFSLASYKNVFYQIKRTQNEVLARQAHWQAEGGLECGFAEIKSSGILPNDALFQNICESNIADTTISFALVNSNQFDITSTSLHVNTAKAAVAKSIIFGGGINSTIKMNASVLELTGSQHFVPNPTENTTSSGFSACQSVVTSGTVSYVSSPSGTDEHFLTTDSTVSSHARSPSGSVSFTCDSGYLSNLFDMANIPTGLNVSDFKKAQDILENTPVDVFMDIFDVSHSEWKSVRDDIAKEAKGDIVGPYIINGKGGDAITLHGWVSDCSNIVKESFEAGNKKIWVDGSCALGANIFGGVVSDKTIMLMIHGGFLEFNASGAFNGLLYQYVSPLLDAKTLWEDRVDNIAAPTKAFNKSDIDPAFLNVSFFVNGLTYIDGAIGIDAPSRKVKINGSIIPSYNADKSNEFIDGDLSWIEGSWHDF